MFYILIGDGLHRHACMCVCVYECSANVHLRFVCISVCKIYLGDKATVNKNKLQLVICRLKCLEEVH